MLSCTVHDRYNQVDSKVSVSRDKEGDDIYLDTICGAGGVFIYLSIRAARRLFRQGLLMCDEIEKGGR